MPEDHEAALDMLTKRRETLLRNIESERVCVAERQAEIAAMLALLCDMQAEQRALAITIGRLKGLD